MLIDRKIIRRLIVERISKQYSDQFYRDNPEVLDMNDPSQFHMEIETTTNFSQDFKKSLREWSSNEVNVLKRDLLRRKNIDMVIRELFESSGNSVLEGSNYTLFDVFSTYGQFKSRTYVNNLKISIAKSYMNLLNNFLKELPRSSYEGFDDVVMQLAKVVEGYSSELSMNNVRDKVEDAVSSAQRGIFGRIYDFFAGREGRQLLESARDRSIEDIGTAIAFYYMRHRVGEAVFAENSAFYTPEVLERGAKSRFTRSPTFLIYLLGTAGKKASQATQATAQARKDYFRRVMARKEGTQGSLENWFAVHYPYAYAMPEDGQYFDGVLNFIKGTSKITSTGDLSRSKDELGVVAYPKSYKRLNDSLAIGRAGNGRHVKIAVVLDGKITAIYRNDVYSSTFSDPGIGGFRGDEQEQSGFVRYAGAKGSSYRKSVDARSKLMIYDLEAYEKEIHKNKGFPGRSGYNEAFLDNWRATGVACDWYTLLKQSDEIFLGNHTNKRKTIKALYLSLTRMVIEIKKRNLKVYDNKFNEMSINDLSRIFDALINKVSKSMGLRGRSNISKTVERFKPEEKEIYFKVIRKMESGREKEISSYGDKKITVNKAIKAFEALNDYFDKIGSPTRPKFLYGTEKSKRGKIIWKQFSPRAIKKAIIEEQFKNTLLDIQIL